MKITAPLLLLLALALAAGPVAADDFQPIDDIRGTAEAFALALAPGADTRAEAAGLDQRLRLPRCEKPLEAFTTGSARPGRALTVGVRCPQAGSWSLYVPVRMQISREVLVASRTLRRGSPLDATMLRREQRDVSALPHGYFEDLAVVSGQILIRDLTPGSVIVPAALRQPTLIDRGQSVTLISRSGGIEIRARGKALAAGGASQRIRVRNASSGRIVEGIVRSADIVEVAG